MERVNKTNKPRFLNFPLYLLSNTITEPKRAMERITSYAVVNYSRHCRPPDWETALIQAAYTRSQRPHEALPDDVQDILQQENVDEFVGALRENFIGGEGDGADFIDGCREMLKDNNIELDSEENEAICQWYAMQKAAEYFHRTILNYEGVFTDWQDVENEEGKPGSRVWCSVPAGFAFEVKKHLRDLDLFRAVAACRSIIGKRWYVGTHKSVIQRRCIGAKNKDAVAELTEDPEIKAEFDRLGRRRQMDGLLERMAARGFVTKLGLGRQIYISTQYKLTELTDNIQESRHIQRQRKAEREARRRIREQVE